jgi:hypothetical protein
VFSLDGGAARDFEAKMRRKRRGSVQGDDGQQRKGAAGWDVWDRGGVGRCNMCRWAAPLERIKAERRLATAHAKLEVMLRARLGTHQPEDGRAVGDAK